MASTPEGVIAHALKQIPANGNSREMTHGKEWRYYVTPQKSRRKVALVFSVARKNAMTVTIVVDQREFSGEIRFYNFPTETDCRFVFGRNFRGEGGDKLREFFKIADLKGEDAVLKCLVSPELHFMETP